MKLRFVTINNSPVPVPGVIYHQGQHAPRVGMRWDSAAGRYVCTRAPLEVDSRGPGATALSKWARAGDVVPFDATTATAVGVAFKPVRCESADDGWFFVPAAGGDARKPTKDAR